MCQFVGPRIVKPQFGLHLLIRLSDREGNDIGQVCDMFLSAEVLLNRTVYLIHFF